MPFLTVLTRDHDVLDAVEVGSREPLRMARVSTWERLSEKVKERPITGLVLDSQLLPEVPDPVDAVRDLTDRFPSVWSVLVTRPGADPRMLLELGRAGLQSLIATHLDDLFQGVADGLRRGVRRGTDSLVTQAVSPYLPPELVRAVHLAMVGSVMGWGADDLAAHAGYSRAHLSVLFREQGFPSTGHLLAWARLLHAGRWLEDYGRTAESISRQLDYSSGAAFRRLLRNYTGLTPTQVRRGGGLRLVLDMFLHDCGQHLPQSVEREVA